MSIKNHKLEPINIYIQSLIENLNKNTIPKNIDLILEGGAFNGGYQLGILLYLKELEKNNIINIDKISGCSVGSMLGALYVGNFLDKGVDFYEQILQYYKCNSDLVVLSNLVKNFVNNYVDDISIFNNKLYITYYNLKDAKQIVVSTYKTKDDLIDAIIKSSYIPYIIDGKLHHYGYCDGFFPYIFPTTKKQILYIYLHPIQKIKNMLYVKNEENVWKRLLIGINDVNNFFLGSNSEFCSYMNKWSLIDIFIFHIKELIVVLILLILNSLQKLLYFIPNEIKHNKYLIRISIILQLFYKDVFRYILL